MSSTADEPRALPRYIQVEAALRTLLETGGYRPGDKLPPEPSLAQQMEVSRATLREALRSFEQQGIISRRQGMGTFVNRRPLYIESGLETLESIELLLQSRQLTPTLKRRQARSERALPKAASRLALKEGTPLTVVSSTYAVDEQCVAYLLEVAPAGLVAEEAISGETTSLLAYMIEEKGHFDIAYAVAHIAPIHGSEEICAALEIGSETLLFFIDQTVYTSTNLPCYYSRNYYLPTVFDFHLIRRIRET
ncbi:MAG: GntR family transcriptional regulator [Caldilineaceae bacterium]|nr:GntR family transcriptional regulator [Caldilineaceae bacterium]